MQDEFHLELTQEEGFLLLTGARLFDKLVAGVTIHSQEKDELIRDVISKLSEIISPQMEAMSNELADAIVDSVLGCGDLDDGELEELELACLESDLEEMLIDEFFNNPPPIQLSIEGLGEKVDESDLEEDYSRMRNNDFFMNTRPSKKPSNTPPFYLEEEEEVYLADRSTVRKFERFLADQTFAYPMYAIEEKLPVLEKSLVKHKTTQVNYYCIERETVDPVTIDPLVLLQEEGIWLVVAYCHERDDILIFRADRMKDVKETTSQFQTPKDINNLRCQLLASYK
jgi:hypothetical protein